MTEDEIDAPSSNLMAESIGEALLHDRAQLPPVVLGQCEEETWPLYTPVRCSSTGLLVGLPLDDARYEFRYEFRCPRHGASLERAVRRWPR